MEMYLILLNLMLYLTLAQAERREGLKGRSWLFRPRSWASYSEVPRAPRPHNALGTGSWLRAEGENCEFCRENEGQGPWGSRSNGGPPSSHCDLNKNVGRTGGKALDQELRGLGEVFILLFPTHVLTRNMRPPNPTTSQVSFSAEPESRVQDWSPQADSELHGRSTGLRVDTQ